MTRTRQGHGAAPGPGDASSLLGTGRLTLHLRNPEPERLELFRICPSAALLISHRKEPETRPAAPAVREAASLRRPSPTPPGTPINTECTPPQAGATQRMQVPLHCRALANVTPGMWGTELSSRPGPWSLNERRVAKVLEMPGAAWKTVWAGVHNLSLVWREREKTSPLAHNLRQLLQGACIPKCLRTIKLRWSHGGGKSRRDKCHFWRAVGTSTESQHWLKGSTGPLGRGRGLSGSYLTPQPLSPRATEEEEKVEGPKQKERF